jgi:hypothetical protein
MMTRLGWGMLLATALLLCACAQNGAPAPKVWRNAEGIEVDPVYGTPVPGRPGTY